MLQRVLIVFCIAVISPIAFSSNAFAESALFGSPIIEETGHMRLDGWTIDLWGIDVLAADQKCWRDGLDWGCGEQATTALQHYIAGRPVKCIIKETHEIERSVVAQCSFDKNGQPHDIARYMVMQGWAMDNPDQSGSFYDNEEQDARQHRRGVWTSRFQTAEDWSAGIERYVEYDMEPEPQHAPNIGNEIVVNTYVIHNYVPAYRNLKHTKHGRDRDHDRLHATATSAEISNTATASKPVPQQTETPKSPTVTPPLAPTATATPTITPTATPNLAPTATPTKPAEQVLPTPPMTGKIPEQFIPKEQPIEKTATPPTQPPAQQKVETPPAPAKTAPLLEKTATSATTGGTAK